MFAELYKYIIRDYKNIVYLYIKKYVFPHLCVYKCLALGVYSCHVCC